MRRWLLSLRYAAREMRGWFSFFAPGPGVSRGLGGEYIFLACLILGVAAIAAVQSTSRGLIESLRYDGRYILGGDLSLRTVYQPATPEQLRYLRKNIGPVNIVMETRAMVRKVSDAEKSGITSALVELKAVDPFYPLYGSLAFADGNGNAIQKTAQDLLLPTPHEKNAPENDDWGAVVEKDLLTQMNISVGDSIMVGKRAFIIRGVITKEPDRIGRSRFSLAPRVMISSYIFDATGLSDYGNHVYYDHRVVIPYVHTPAEMKAVEDQITQAFPTASWKGRTAFNATPQMERLIEQITQFMTLIGLTTLLVGGVGISNAVNSLLTAKRASIATLKCLGAQSDFTFRLYLIMIFFMTAIGALIGMGFGAGIAKYAGSFLTARLSLSDQTGFYPEILLRAGAFGLLTSLCFSLWPLGRAVNVRPSQLFRDMIAPAVQPPSLSVKISILIVVQLLILLVVTDAADPKLSLFFMGGAVLVYTVFVLYAEALKKFFAGRGLQKYISSGLTRRLAIANLHRPGNLTVTVVLSLGLGLTVLTAVALVENNFSRLIRSDLAQDTPAFFFLDVQPDQVAAFKETIQQTPGAHNLLITPSLRGRIARVNDIPAEEALVDKNESWVIQSDRGFTYTAAVPPHSRITAGEWWPADYQGPPIMSIAGDVARAFDIGVGDKITVNIMGSDITATVANVREVDWSSFTMNFAITFAPGFLEKIPSSHLATVAMNAGYDETAVQNMISEKFPNVSVIRVKAALETAGTFMRAIAQAIRVGAGVTLIVGLLVLAGGISAARQRHVYDAVVLKVLGARKKQILGVFLLEYGALGILTVLIAAVLGSIVAWAMVVFVMKLTWVFSPWAVVRVLVLALVLTIGTGYLGTFRALRQKPAGYLRNL